MAAAVTPDGPAGLVHDPALLKDLAATAPVAFATIDRELRYVQVNDRLAALTGLPAWDHRGRAVRDVPALPADAVEAQVGAVLSDGAPRLGIVLSAAGRLDRWSTSWYPVRDRAWVLVGVALLATELTRSDPDEQRRQTALTLQRSLLPSSVPSTDELEVAVRYLAGKGDGVGGDLYDVVPLGAGRMALVVGDVMGRGVHAAAVMGQLRTAVRTCARLDLRPAEVLEVLDGLADDLGSTPFDSHIATCLYAVFDPYTRDLQLATAGHLPPVARTAAGGVERLAVEVSAPLGVGDLPRESRVHVAAGTVLALFTDGLLERRDRDLDAGLDALCRALADGPDDLEQLADAVLDRLLDEPTGDDVALLLVRVPPDADSRSRTVAIPVPRERALLLSVRSQARSAMQSWALLDDVVEVATLLASELVTNALLHGTGPVELRMRLTRDRLVVEVEDGGRLMPRRRRARPDEEGGRGLQLVASLADRWGGRATDDGKVVWAELDLAVPR